MLDNAYSLQPRNRNTANQKRGDSEDSDIRSSEWWRAKTSTNLRHGVDRTISNTVYLYYLSSTSGHHKFSPLAASAAEQTAQALANEVEAERSSFLSSISSLATGKVLPVLFVLRKVSAFHHLASIERLFSEALALEIWTETAKTEPLRGAMLGTIVTCSPRLAIPATLRLISRSEAMVVSEALLNVRAAFTKK